MKVSEYLWKSLELDSILPKDVTQLEVQGRMMEIMMASGDGKIVSDTTGAEMVDSQAMSIYGRNQDQLNEAFTMGRRDLFDMVCINQLRSDDEYHAKKNADK